MVAIVASTAIALLVALVLAKYSDVTKKVEKAMAWVAAGAVSMLVAEVLDGATAFTADISAVGQYLGTGGLFGLIGWILVLIGGVIAVYKLVVG